MELRDAVLLALAEMDDLIEETGKLAQQSKHTNIKPEKVDIPEIQKIEAPIRTEEDKGILVPKDEVEIEKIDVIEQTIAPVIEHPINKPQPTTNTPMDIRDLLIEPKKTEKKPLIEKVFEPLIPETPVVETKQPVVEPKVEPKKEINIPKAPVIGITDDIHSEKLFLERLRERLLVLFDGLQDDSMVNRELKFDMVINFLEYMLAMSEKRLDELK
jgi:hypothetical protein